MRRVFSILLALLAANSSFAQFYLSTNEDNTLTIVGYYGSNETVVVPSEIGGLTVSTIGENAFYNYYSNIVSSISLPSSVTDIEDDAFYAARGLTNVAFSPGLTNIGQWAFFKTSLVSVEIPETVVNIDEAAFYECPLLLNATLSDGLVTIGQDAFGWCTNLRAVNVPSTVTNLVQFAFDNDPSLSAIAVSPGNNFYSSSNGILFDKFQRNLIQYPGGREGAFSVPSSVTNLYPYSVAYAARLTNVAFESPVTQIPVGSFFECTNLLTVDLPSQLGDLGSQAFGDCWRLQSVVLPNTLTNLEDYAFEDCVGLTNVCLSTNITQIADGVFNGCSNLQRIYFPPTVSSLGNGCFTDCLDLTNVICGGTITNIGEFSFAFSDGLRSVFFSGDPPTVDWTAFNGDTSATVYYLDQGGDWTNFSIAASIPAVYWNPQILTDRRDFSLQNGQIQFDIIGTPGIPCAVESTTNLATANWIRSATFSLTNGVAHFAFPVFGEARFFRPAFPGQ